MLCFRKPLPFSCTSTLKFACHTAVASLCIVRLVPCLRPKHVDSQEITRRQLKITPFLDEIPPKWHSVGPTNGMDGWTIRRCWQCVRMQARRKNYERRQAWITIHVLVDTRPHSNSGFWCLHHEQGSDT